MWRMIPMFVLVVLCGLTRIDACDEDCDCELDALCGLWSVDFPTMSDSLPPDQPFEAVGHKPKSALGTKERLQRNVNGTWQTVDTQNTTGSSIWRRTFTPPTGGWNPGSYRVQILNGNNGVEATGETFEIYDPNPCAEC